MKAWRQAKKNYELQQFMSKVNQAITTDQTESSSEHLSEECELGVEASVDESSDPEEGSTKARTVEPHTETVWDIESHVKSGPVEEDVMKEFGRQKTVLSSQVLTIEQSEHPESAHATSPLSSQVLKIEQSEHPEPCPCN
jgi:hypothetical protein